ncbi:cucumisin-like [Impatiens glandulifera]|uniref:cucumisin-like n=1 Tax=Impatiens glandulifera TaxID=253017 RepID=UPI001FB10F61|nr:cucumisin-like [Impatiens glandulifera]
MGDLNPTSDIPTPILHSSFLEKALHINSSASVIHSYKSIFNGFVALLTTDEVHLLSSMEEVVSVFPNRKNHMHTTKSWDFLKFPRTIKRQKEVESNIIVGVIDSGIWPELDSFSDVGMRSPPSKWKGSCHGLRNFKCNNKIIGGRYYKRDGIFSQDDIKSPRDTLGHGTHIASIIVGNLVSSANFYGLGEGTARGGVPSSRIAVYKVLWVEGADDIDTIHAFEDAISDGVDIISISLGSIIIENYMQNSISIGTFQAMRKGIMTICSSGNNGPRHRTVRNVSPWDLTVAASSTDRKIVNYLKLGNMESLLGSSMNAFDQTNFSTLVYAGDVPNIREGFSPNTSRFCQETNSLDARFVSGKIVICAEQNRGDAALFAGAIGMVIIDPRYDFFEDKKTFALPTTVFNEKESSIFMRYFQNSRQPDLSAPGVRILAAWLPTVSPSTSILDTRRLSYNIISGTSMACPHAAAAAAYVKSFHPSWSPAAIKSALITTASEMSVKTNPEAEFGYGAGLINPVGAINPGLVYDANLADYVQFLCGQNYTNKQLSLITGDKIACTHYGSKTSLNLNMPSFSFPIVPSNTPFNVSVNRRVTNVGSLRSTYIAKILTPPTFTIRVVPSTLSFTNVGEIKSFTLIVEGIMDRVTAVSASLSWMSSTNEVSKPRHGYVRFFKITAILVRFPSSNSFPPPSWWIFPRARPSTPQQQSSLLGLRLQAFMAQSPLTTTDIEVTMYTLGITSPDPTCSSYGSPSRKDSTLEIASYRYGALGSFCKESGADQFPERMERTQGDSTQIQRKQISNKHIQMWLWSSGLQHMIGTKCESLWQNPQKR